MALARPSTTIRRKRRRLCTNNYHTHLLRTPVWETNFRSSDVIRAAWARLGLARAWLEPSRGLAGSSGGPAGACPAGAGWLGPGRLGLGWLVPSRLRSGQLGPGWGPAAARMRPGWPWRGLAQWFIPALMTYQWKSNGFPAVFSSGLLASSWCLAVARCIF